MAKITVTIDGKQSEVDVPDEQIQAAGFMQTGKFNEELTRRGVSLATKQGYVKPDEMTNEQIEALAKTKGVKFETVVQNNPADTATAIQEAVAKKRTEWERAELDPIKTKNTALEEEGANLLQQKLHSQIIAAAAAAGVEKSMLKPLTKNTLPPIVSMLQDVFAFDTDTKQFLVLADDGEGPAFSDRPTADHPFKDVEEYVDQWSANKDNAKFIEVTAQRGPNLQGTMGSARAGGGPIHLSKADSRNARLVAAATAEAAKRGLDPMNGGVVYDN